jgi:hypothetical protein
LDGAFLALARLPIVSHSRATVGGCNIDVQYSTDQSIAHLKEKNIVDQG